MAIHGPDPLETDAATYVLGEVLVNLQRRIRDDLAAAKHDGVLERPTLGAVLCLRALLEAFPDHGFQCHTKDVEEWKSQFLAWYDVNSPQMKLSAKHRKQLRDAAVTEFDRVLAQTESTGYRLGNK